MPQVRDPKTGRYTSGGGSSVGGAAGTNPRIQKAKAIGGGATAWGNSKVNNPISQLTDDEVSAVDTLIKGKESIISNAPVKNVPLNNIKSMQKTLRKDSIQYFESGGTAKGYPTILQTAKGNVILDGNHRVNQALKNNKKTIKAHHVKVDDLYGK